MTAIVSPVRARLFFTFLPNPTCVSVCRPACRHLLSRVHPPVPRGQGNAICMGPGRSVRSAYGGCLWRRQVRPASDVDRVDAAHGVVYAAAMAGGRLLMEWSSGCGINVESGGGVMRHRRDAQELGIRVLRTDCLQLACWTRPRGRRRASRSTLHKDRGAYRDWYRRPIASGG